MGSEDTCHKKVRRFRPMETSPTLKTSRRRSIRRHRQYRHSWAAPCPVFFSWLVSDDLYNYTASTAAVVDATLLSLSPDAIRAVFLTKMTPRQLTQFLFSLILRCNDLHLCSRVCGECPIGVLKPYGVEPRQAANQVCDLILIYITRFITKRPTTR